MGEAERGYIGICLNTKIFYNIHSFVITISYTNTNMDAQKSTIFISVTAAIVASLLVSAGMTYSLRGYVGDYGSEYAEEMMNEENAGGSEGCESDSDCDVGVCEEGSCVEWEECQTDEDCGEGEQCALNYCVTEAECESDSDCAEDEYCSYAGWCMEDEEVAEDTSGKEAMPEE